MTSSSSLCIAERGPPDRAHGPRQEGIATPVPLLTARNEVSDRVVGLNAGTDDYLGKRIAVAELRARVRPLLRRYCDHKASPGMIAEHVWDYHYGFIARR